MYKGTSHGETATLVRRLDDDNTGEEDAENRLFLADYDQRPPRNAVYRNDIPSYITYYMAAEFFRVPFLHYIDNTQGFNN